ncbi:hypothetical protein J3R03_005629 [Actinoplanes couchii]|nr:hypothetical protein [Actinoplanes couchii]
MIACTERQHRESIDNPEREGQKSMTRKAQQ